MQLKRPYARNRWSRFRVFIGVVRKLKRNVFQENVRLVGFWQYSSRMPETPITLAVPDRCPNCQVAGRVRLQQTIQGNRVLLEWVCQACSREWLVRHKDEHPDKP